MLDKINKNDMKCQMSGPFYLTLSDVHYCTKVSFRSTSRIHPCCVSCNFSHEHMEPIAYLGDDISPFTDSGLF